MAIKFIDFYYLITLTAVLQLVSWIPWQLLTYLLGDMVLDITMVSSDS